MRGTGFTIPSIIGSARGILMTCYLKGDPEQVCQTLSKAYLHETFIRVLPFGEVPQMKDVRASNFCHIGVVGDRVSGRATVIAAVILMFFAFFGEQLDCCWDSWKKISTVDGGGVVL